MRSFAGLTAQYDLPAVLQASERRHAPEGAERSGARGKVYFLLREEPRSARRGRNAPYRCMAASDRRQDTDGRSCKCYTKLKSAPVRVSLLQQQLRGNRTVGNVRVQQTRISRGAANCGANRLPLAPYRMTAFGRVQLEVGTTGIRRFADGLRIQPKRSPS